MRILLLGKNGQVGWELQRALAPIGELSTLDRTQVDLANPTALLSVLDKLQPQIIVNAAAYTAVDKAETEQKLAYAVNAETVRILANYCLNNDAWLIHYSTDYVYDGSKLTAYVETDKTNPLSVYGNSKLAGEEHLRNSNCKYLNFRTSWVFASKGHNFIKSIIKLAKERTELKVIADQFGAPTSAELIADVTALCLQQILLNDEHFGRERIGTYHLVASGEASWHSYAQHIVNKVTQLQQKLLITANNILPIPTEEYPLPAVRPKNSRLDTTKLQQKFAINLPDWTYYVDRMLEELH